MGSIFKEKRHYRFLLFAIVLFAISFILDNINNRFQQHDFKVFYLAAQALLNSDQIYNVTFGIGSGWYKYSPITFLLFVPAAILPYKLACIVNFIIILLSILTSIFIVRQLIVKFFITQKVKYENLALSIIQNNYYFIAYFVILLFLFGGNSLDLLGDPLSFIFDEMGILGISNLIIIITTFILYFRYQNSLEQIKTKQIL